MSYPVRLGEGKKKRRKKKPDAVPVKKVSGFQLLDDDIEVPPNIEEPLPKRAPPQFNISQSNKDLSPPRPNDDEDQSPPRKPRRDSDDDLSPPRKSRLDSDDDLSPPRKPRYDSDDDDQSPPRKARMDSDNDQSPPRKKPRYDSDQSPPRKSTIKEELKEDRKIKNEERSPPRRRKRYDSDNDDNSPPRKKDPVKHEPTAEDEPKSNSSMRIHIEGQEPKRKKPKKEADPVQLAKENRDWAMGTKQQQERMEKALRFLEEQNKPFARSKDDDELDDLQKNQARFGDPMANLAKKKKKSKSSKKEKPVYSGPPAPPNRFGIPPGFRWDGRDRTNGFEKQYFKKQSERKAIKDIAYQWSTEDM